MLRDPTIDDLDYALMGADNACARIKCGTEATTGKWVAINKHSELASRSFGNSHGTSYDGGKTYRTEVAYLEAPKADCLVDAAEVVWHHCRVTELRKAGVAQPERVRIMNEERAFKPWEAAP
jgi:hypothetical protein